MESKQEELEGLIRERYEAAQAAQLFEEERLMSHPEHPLSSSTEHREGVHEEMMDILDARFEDDEAAEFAFMLITEAYDLGAEG